MVGQTFAMALEHHQAGRLPAAKELYRQVLQIDPRHADATHLLGVVAGQMGDHADGAEYIARAIELAPGQGDYYLNLGEAYRALKKFPEAVASCRRAVELMPDDGSAHHNLGNALKDNGQFEEAVPCFRRAVQLTPHFADAHFHLGAALQELGQFQEAFASYQRVIDLEPNVAETCFRLGDALMRMGQLVGAIACLRRATELEPDHGEYHNILGCALKDRGQVDEAIACFQRAIELEPNRAEAHGNLGTALQDKGRFPEAISSYRRAIELKPDLDMAYNGLGCVLKEQGQLAEAMGCFRQALEAAPDRVSARSNLLFAMQYQSGVTPKQLAEAHQEYERLHAEPLRSTWRPHDNLRDPDRPLRLGFISPDLHQHPVTSFLIRVLENLDRNECEIACYCHHHLGDKTTARLRAAVTTWRDVLGHTDQQLANQIRADGIDILFDLAGHTGGNRLLVFAHKPAPIQIAWIGYEGTTGLSAMDYLLADRYVLPEGAEMHYCEKVVRMPDGYVCYDPPEAAPTVGSVPALEKEYVTFGSFNNLVKISPEVIAVWAEILHRVPKSRLLLKYRGLGEETVKRRYLDLFVGAGVEPDRLDLLPQSAYADHLAAYGQVDIALDTFPFSGSATTCDALWMGVPVITWPGETFASRHSLSHLSNIGLPDLIAHSRDEYIAMAASLAGDLPRLAVLRAGLRDRMAASPLCNGRQFAANFMPLLRDLWRQWCGQPAEHAEHGQS
jgi:protein O-GlcNAc transferase